MSFAGFFASNYVVDFDVR